MPRITIQDFTVLCDQLADEFIEAAVKDLSHPETQEMIRNAVDTKASRLLGGQCKCSICETFLE